MDVCGCACVIQFFNIRCSLVVSTYSPNHCLIDQVMESDLGKLLRCFCFGQASLRNQNWTICVNKSALHKFPRDPCFEKSAWICCFLQSLFSGICATKKGIGISAVHKYATRNVFYSLEHLETFARTTLRGIICSASFALWYRRSIMFSKESALRNLLANLLEQVCVE